MATKKMIKKLDKVFGAFIRSRKNCEWCAKDGNVVQLQWCHIFTRKCHNTRWSELNSLCLCSGCHRKAHDYPVLFTEWLKDYLGEEIYEELKREHNRTKKWMDYELEELIEKYL
ncbi:MAG: recombination protein NinG [Melioribacteraceae bacterium]